MTRQISLAHLTAIDLAPPKLIEAAAKAGFDAVGLRLIRVTDATPGYPLMQRPAMMAETKAALRDTGLHVSDIEFVKIEPETEVSALVPFLDAGAELGAREVICAPYDPELPRLAETLGKLSDLTEERGMGVSLEFFPWTVVPDLTNAYRMVRMAGPNVGLLVDSLHFDRSDSTLDQLRELPQYRLRLAHLCDAPVQAAYSTEDLLHTARAERLPPGDGQIDLLGFLSALPDSITIGLEVPMTRCLSQMGVEANLERVMSSFSRLIKEADRRNHS
ncbi:sugar phosphate isomerase/epimerase [uncultured Ruegeria sp.]|uniref:sugar phosphate isomerase/epimerase family protein n=1 Tax=uncultured Ruegeria sp. TaxID=259304 RepID=UPI00260C490D|nr:sugar phosphate isomerase/epimerase [uncultured Ruegeria sp.]